MSDEVTRLEEGGVDAASVLFAVYRRRLVSIVDFRMDRRLIGRVDTEDVLQEAWLEIARRLNDYLSKPNVSFFIWVRQITWQTLLGFHRRHLSQKRNADRDVRLRGEPGNFTTGGSIARALCAQLTSPSQAMMRDEEIEQLREALETINDTDREVLALRHFELLTNKEVAEVLQIGHTAASNRYIRALKRLRDVLVQFPAFHDRMAADDQEMPESMR